MQDFFQVLRPGLQLLRPPKKDELGSAGIVAGFVGYSYDAFKQEFGIEPDQVWHPDHNDLQGQACYSGLMVAVLCMLSIPQ